MKNNIVFSTSTNTIRQMPQNYLLAIKNNGAWHLDFDLACSPVFARKVTTAYLNYSVKHGTGENFIECLKGAYHNENT